METLHSILLGPYKYFLRKLIPQLSTAEKEQMQAIITAFNFSGFGYRLDTKIIKHYKSFVGRNFKALAQCSLFIFRNFFTVAEKKVWIALSRVGVQLNLMIKFGFTHL